ncbi:MAG: 3-isopropylmalate dehydratase small subunit [Gammaproteobacteria bacterium]
MKSNSEGLMIDGVVSYIDRDNIDTDQIIPTEYLKSIKKFGYEDYLFDGWRYKDDGKLGIKKEDREINTDFILNNKPYSESKILLTRDNFGCGSSREHAVWALRDFGIKAVIASSFGDIFYNNCFKNNVLPIKLYKSQIEQIFALVKEDVVEFSIDLQKRIIHLNDNNIINFEVEDFLIDRIIYGLDDVDITLKDRDNIANFESNRKITKPWIYINE